MLRFSLFWGEAAFRLAWNTRHFVPQNTMTDCGVASALTVLNMAGRAADPVIASERLDPDRAGTSLNDLRRFFEEDQGFGARALAVSADRVRQVRGQVILHMSRAHYTVLLAASRCGVLCFDPSVGPVFYPQKEFEKLYSGYLLEITRGGNQTAVALPNAVQHRASSDGGGAPVALFLLGVASRLLEAALVLSLCFGLFLVGNRASASSLLAITALVAVTGALLIAARSMRQRGQDTWVWRVQGRLWRSLLRTITRGRDLQGFRNQRETEVAGRLRQGFGIALPRRAQFPAVVGSTMVMAGLLAFLTPLMSLAYLAIAALIAGIAVLDDVSVCRRSVRKNEGKYTPLSRGRMLINARTAPLLMGEISKWGLIGVSGYGVLFAGLPPPVMMFWVLMAMQIVPPDIRNMTVLAQAFVPKVPISPLLGSEAPIRAQAMVSDAPLKLKRGDGVVRIEGIAPLTEVLQHPDLTIREQRLILADVVRAAVIALPENKRRQIGAVRLFGPGQYVTEADFENMALAKDVARGSRLPVKRSEGRVDVRSDPLLRALDSCGDGDFPVFWDMRNQMKLDDLRKGLRLGGCKRAGHLSMSRLTVIEEA